MPEELKKLIKTVEGYQVIPFDLLQKVLSSSQIENLKEFLTGKTLMTDYKNINSYLIFVKDLENFFYQYQ